MKTPKFMCTTGKKSISIRQEYVDEVNWTTEFEGQQISVASIRTKQLINQYYSLVHKYRFYMQEDSSVFN